MSDCVDCAVLRERVARLERAFAGMDRLLKKAHSEWTAAEEALSRIESWTHTYGAALVPSGADTYGEGMRDAKAQVRAALARPSSPDTHSPTEKKSGADTRT